MRKEEIKRTVEAGAEQSFVRVIPDNDRLLLSVHH
jgi:hypothetical protein